MSPASLGPAQRRRACTAAVPVTAARNACDTGRHAHSRRLRSTSPPPTAWQTPSSSRRPRAAPTPGCCSTWTRSGCARASRRWPAGCLAGAMPSWCPTSSTAAAALLWSSSATSPCRRPARRPSRSWVRSCRRSPRTAPCATRRLPCVPRHGRAGLPRSSRDGWLLHGRGAGPAHGGPRARPSGSRGQLPRRAPRDGPPDSVHLLAGRITGEVYIGHADNDGSMPPEQQERLRRH